MMGCSAGSLPVRLATFRNLRSAEPPPAITAVAAAPPPPLLAAAAAPPLPRRKVHGRGAGAGRGLHPRTGEPSFTEQHPSWAARVRQRAREAKAVTRALRATPPPPVLVDGGGHSADG